MKKKLQLLSLTKMKLMMMKEGKEIEGDSIEFSTSTNVNYNGNLAVKEENK